MIVPRRLAVALSLVVFAVCVLCGMQAGNTFAETVIRALKAMLGTLVIGMIIGAMAQKMLDENAAQLKEKEKSAMDSKAIDR
jgi:NhaP-type Na+/H+ or K+/H+ antiporter